MREPLSTGLLQIFREGFEEGSWTKAPKRIPKKRLPRTSLNEMISRKGFKVAPLRKGFKVAPLRNGFDKYLRRKFSVSEYPRGNVSREFMRKIL